MVRAVCASTISETEVNGLNWWRGVAGTKRADRMEVRAQFEDGDFGANVWESPIVEADYFVIDIETSGFSPATDTVLSLAAGCMQGADPTLNPTLYDVIHTDAVADVPAAVWDLTGLTPEAVVCGKSLHDVLLCALSMSVNHVWIAHHARHELSFLQRHTRQLWRMPLRPVVIDTSVVARALLRLHDVPTLEAVCKWLDIPVSNRHQADADVRMTAQVWARELELCRQAGLYTVSEVVEWTTSQV